MTEHILKTWPASFKDIRTGKKKFEIRIADRDYAVGDELLLREFDLSRLSDADRERLANAERGALQEMSPATREDVEAQRAKALAPAYTGHQVRVGVTYIYANLPGVPVYLGGFPATPFGGTIDRTPQQVVVMGIAIIKEGR